MQRRLKESPVLIFTLAVLMFICLAYLQSDGLVQIHFLSPDLALGNFAIADKEGLATDSPGVSLEVVSASLIYLSHQRPHPSWNLFQSSFQPSFRTQKLTILRC